MITAEEIKAKYWALEVLSSHNQEDINNISGSLGTSKIDLNPHQINAAMFALQSPISQGVILADEVGLGKTIEAGIVISDNCGCSGKFMPTMANRNARQI